MSTVTIRLDPEYERKLDDLTATCSSRTEAVKYAISQAWNALQEDRLDAAYAAVVAEYPCYPYDSKDERDAARARRNRRQGASE